ncbi:NADH-ubiquinone oxidoreductase-F iron-sulfur binding region domain-containing protein [Botryobacter ruber]|uniref:NADH-ubiquinone oxidoreductase-F iron-sulfur binding region domain-containing protein n=1 Tax=Botryobacter ruber TaxID=2171629 RepID=UPI000E0AEBAD|nr:NADH-ubiquinone oxidoreductase-F iron-sulfur binding region domain-containing protein [Botryobacter ruber]
MKTKARSELLNHLWELHTARGYLSDEDVARTSAAFGLSAVDVEGVISFYHFFHRRPAGTFTIYLNNSILSRFNGFEKVKAAFEKETGAKAGGVSSSGMFGLFETSCIGLSDREPAALINFQPFTRLTPGKVRSLIRSLKAGSTPAALADTIEERIQYKPEAGKAILFRKFVPGKVLTRLKALPPDQVISMIKDSGLTGRGGAFFPTGLKRELCKNAEGSTKYIVCNADEGEPGTFKDRALLNLLPGLVIEGMLIAGYAVGAQEGIIYLRAEYCWLLPKLHQALICYRKKGYLGRHIPALGNYRFDIRVQLGAGAYICGEETALLESMEGKRGEPRPKTVFPTDKGFLGMPTVVNNVETFCAAARIVELGAEKFRSLGVPGSAGTKLLSVAGDCKYPGLYEIEWGMKVSELLDRCGAENPKYIQMSGPSGELISIDEKDRTLSCDDIRCGGSVMVFNANRDLFTILHNFSAFFTHESCGLCTPCRAGNPQLLHLLEKLQKGQATTDDVSKMQQWAETIKHTSRCGLGQTAPNSLEQAIQKFPQLFRDKVTKSDLFNPAFDLAKATHTYNQLTHESA